MFTRKNISSFFVLFFISLNVIAIESSPYQVITSAGNKLFSRIASEQQALKTRPELMRMIVEQELMPYVDYRYAAFKILGKNLRTINKEQREKFVAAMKIHLSQTYVQALSRYSNQKVSFEPEQALNKRKIVSVKSKIIQIGKPDIKIDFRLRKNKKSQQWQAFDMVVEGISLLDAKQAEITAKIRDHGIDRVIDELAPPASS